MYRLRVFSPNYTCAKLRAIRLHKRVALLFGSTKQHNFTSDTLVLNSINGIRISSDKRLSKKAMDEAQVNHAEWLVSNSRDEIIDFFQTHQIIIIKKYNSCKGNDIYYIDNIESLNIWLNDHRLTLRQYVYEKYYNFKREYRFHVDKNHGIFYGCRKLLKNDAEEVWHRHDINSVWILPSNPKFKKPTFIDEIERQCKAYMEIVGLDICTFDIKSNNDTFIILESNTAPSLGDYGLNVYRNHIMKYYGH